MGHALMKKAILLHKMARVRFHLLLTVDQWHGRTLTMGHALLKKAILLLKKASVQFDLLLAIGIVFRCQSR